MALTRFKKITSLNNLKSGSAGGQIATLMILIIVFILSLILLTVNIGQVGVQSTKLANAADSSALQLASQLASKGRLLGEQLGHGTFLLARCQRTGILSTVLAIAGAIMASLIAGPAGALLWGTIAGAIGGGLGGLLGG